MRKALLTLVVLGTMAPFLASAQATDLATTITAISGYWSSVLTIGIGIILFVVGRKVVKKI